MKKRLLSGILCLCILLAMFPAIAPAASADGKVIASGYCGGERDGKNLSWTLTDDYTLTISGKGDMRNYGTDSRAPWYEYRRSVKTLVIESGVTSIGSCTFNECISFTGKLVIPDGVTSIGAHAFHGCRGFTGNLVIPASVTSIGDRAFGCCDGLSNIYFKGNAPAVSGNAELFSTSSSFLIAFLYTFGGDYESVVDDHPGFTIHYIPGTTGWTDSKYYDAGAGTWNGIKLVAWNDGGIGVTDVSTNDWFHGYVADMTKAGVVSGYPDVTFRPKGNVTWGEALKLVLKATGYGEFEAGTHWASGYMDKALADGFIDHEVDLNSAITRGEMADLTAKAMKLAPSTSPNPIEVAVPISA